MQKIKKNLTAIQKKFQSLKYTHKLYQQPTPIGEVAQLMTYGVISESQVALYLDYVHNSQLMMQKQRINQNWYQLSIQQMILFLDKVIKFTKINKPKQKVKKQRLNLMAIKKKKTKKRTMNDHQNPYIPNKIQVNQRDLNQGQNKQVQQNGDAKNNQQQNYVEQTQSPYISSEDQEQDQSPIIHQHNQILEENQNQLNQNQKKIQSKQQMLDLPQNFKTLPVEDRYQLLASKYYSAKQTIEKKINSVYKHYKKQMYLPHQSFQKNNQLMMDLRIFLKYYKEFQISKRYKTIQATTHFKKIALNGLWLDHTKFIQIHYFLIQILSLNDQQLNQRLQKRQINDKKKINQLKKLLSKNAKILMDNLIKLKDLSQLVSDQKIKKVFNDQSGRKMVKKIVQVHSGLIKEDVMLKLNQRAQQRKKKNANLLNNSILLKYNSQNLSQKNPNSTIKYITDDIFRMSPDKLSIYKQLQIPKLRSREMKKSSVYSSLQLLNMHKQRQKLKQLINQQQNEKYLQAYFKKQKLLTRLMRSNSIQIRKSSTQTQQNQKTGNTFNLKRNKSTKQVENDNIFLRNSISLPRMKFS